MSNWRRALCAVYAAVAVAALVGTWSQNLAYFHDPADFFAALGVFVEDTRATPASRSVAVDIALIFLAAAIFMVVEARKHGIKYVWAYVVGGLFVAISVTFPLFLIARELRLSDAEGAAPSTIDVVVLSGFALLSAGLSLYVVGLAPF